MRHIKNSFPLLAAVTITLCCISCRPINPCGTFAFTGSAFTGEFNGIDMNVHFAFNPGSCSSDCNTNTICYIQMVRTYNYDEGTYSYISEEHEARAIEYGWYIDRVTGRNWGYYGRNDDGTFADYLSPGNNTTDAVLSDRPQRLASMHNIWWQAVSASVSIDGGTNSCNNNYLGYYFWSWIADDAGITKDDYIIHGVAWEDLQNMMDAAVAAWNTQAPGLGHNSFPNFDKLMY